MTIVDPVRSESLRVAQWVVTTCLLFGTTIETAYKVAGCFAQGMETDPACAAWRTRMRMVVGDDVE